ncbi:MAG: hypothetical protein GFH27_549297n321 [Chloroflexi bacterium AL-W]|nr:hypothetical protein [Chloroflexi bacterium AL-N1]NOK68826.1 hypothetical protein [Chloroflexi bacterium AL-N10]NOK76810.1 hypothetical protein [Chloroflexi bacterium AL-N5]NOK82803.1 hypothetical protein [Chloroflexi bacterium AL-W]NOK90667.1 hypothetical protein [Chloroflexi bacterium AL-N15]
MAECPLPDDPTCAASLFFARYLNELGLDNLHAAIDSGRAGFAALQRETTLERRMVWRIALQRNIAVAYHCVGDLAAARAAIDDALQLVEQYQPQRYKYTWSLYEKGVLEQRAGYFDTALDFLCRAEEGLQHDHHSGPLERWIIVAKGHLLRDTGQLAEAEACFQRGGWGEGTEGPLMLWLLQGRYTEARCAAEAHLAAAQASDSPIVAMHLKVLLALLDLETQPSLYIREQLRAAATCYANSGFRYHHASVLLHLAAVEYALGDTAAGDAALADALHFGANSGYRNFAWWQPQRMQMLLQRAVQSAIEVDYSTMLLRVRALDRQAVSRLWLRCFGQFEVLLDDQPIPPERWRVGNTGVLRMQRMLLCLARNRAPQSSEQIARYVWSDSWEQINLNDNFHLTLNGLRRVLEPNLAHAGESQCILTTKEGYQLASHIQVDVDLDTWLAQAHTARQANSKNERDVARTAFLSVEQEYTGDFALARHDPLEAAEYHHVFCEAVRWLATDDLDQKDFAACLTRAKRLLHEDRYDATASELVISALLALGNRRAARRQYQRHLETHETLSPALHKLIRKHRL